MPERVNLSALDVGGLERLFAELGEPPYRAVQLFRRLHRHRAASLDEASELSIELRSRLGHVAEIPALGVEERAVDEGGTEKVIFSLDGPRGPARVETVWIASESRGTVCVSCQSGCTLDCSFCATGTLPFAGNLEAWQIVAQVYALERLRGERATNVVFMGMGEPMHNYDAVIAAAQRLCDADGAALGHRRITVSTAGVVPGIERFTRERQPFRLAVSLNHTDDEGRSELMAVNRRHPLDEVLAAARRYTRSSGRRVTFEYVLIAGRNDGPENAGALARIARGLRCKVNLIPLNTDFAGLSRPSDEAVERFRRRLVDAGVAAFNRGSPGRSVAGACGMLALRRRAEDVA